MSTEPEKLQFFNYLLFEPGQERMVEAIELPLNRMRDDYMARVNQELRKRGFIADEETIRLFTPKNRLLITTAETNEWRESIDNPSNHFIRLMPRSFLSNIDNRSPLDDDEIVHLIVVASWKEIAFNYLLFDANRKWEVDSVRLPLNNYRSDCLIRVAEALRKTGFTAAVDTIKLFMAPDDLTVEAAVSDEWRATITTPATAFKHLSPSRPLFEAFATEKMNNLDVLHLIVIAEASQQTGTSLEETDTVPPLDKYCVAQFSEFHNRYLSKNAKTPSAAAKSSQFLINQRTKAPIYDGRRAHGPTFNSSTIAMPPSLYHPVFARWKKQAFDPLLKPPPEVVEVTAELMRKASVLYDSEKQRSDFLRALLQRLLGRHIQSIANTNQSQPDGCITCPLQRGNITINLPAAILEEKLHQSEGTDATTQASFSMIQAWTDPILNDTYTLMCCPTFLLGFRGCQLEISAAVLTDKCIVERMAILWVGRSTTFDQNRIVDTARVFHALSVALKELDQWYKSDAIANAPLYDIVAKTPSNHPRFFPHAVEYPSVGEDFRKTIKFKYMHPLEASSLCVTFLARTSSEDADDVDIVVKFTQRYCPALHRLLADHDMAPTLRYCGKIDESTPYQNWQMVVMDYFDGSSPMSEAAARETGEDVRKAVAIGHEKGFVFGDIRRPNVLVRDGKVKLIDFDWAGKDGEAQYPPDMSDNTELWVDGMKPVALIQKEHDLRMIDKWFPQ